MKVKAWNLIEESTGGAKLPVGGYVIKILDVEDVPSREYLRITYDIAEGEHAGHYSDAFGKQNAWSHQFVRSYKDSAEGMFKAFLNRLEESNKMSKGFTVEKWSERSDERDFIGLTLGAVIQKRLYTNDNGEDKEALEVARVYAAQDIRNGDFEVPEPRDVREQVAANPKPQAQASASIYDESIPF